MKPLEIKGARARLGFTQADMATRMNMSVCSYNAKERGITKFSDKEKVMLVKVLELSWPQANDIFFDGEMPTG